MSKKDKKDTEDETKVDADDTTEEEDDSAENTDDDTEDGSDEDESEEDDKGDGSSKNIDYKAVAEKEKARNKKLEEIIIKNKVAKKKDSENDSDDEGDEDIDDDDKPITRKNVRSVLEAERQKMTLEVYADKLKEFAEDMSESPEEAEAILEVHKNRRFPSDLSIREQVEECHAIVNRKRLASKNSELRRALGSKNSAGNNAGSSYRDGQKGVAPKQSESDKAAYKRAGFAYEPKDKVWKKKLPNGNFLIKNPKTGITYVRPK